MRLTRAKVFKNAYYISTLPAEDPDRQQQLIRFASGLNVCIAMTAEPGFSEHADFIEAITMVARSIDGFFYVPAGFLDSESRALLMTDGVCDPAARLPAPPERPAADAEPTTADERNEAAFAVPPARRVAERMFVTLAVAYRTLLETHADMDEAARRLRRLATWFWSLEIGHELEPNEQAVLDAPLGSLSEHQRQEFTCAFDAAALLAWALRLMEMRSHDQLIEARDVTEALGLFSEDARFVIDSADLRDPLELRAAADRIMAVHWRFRDFETNQAPLDFQATARDAWCGTLDLIGIPLVDTDLAISSTSISRADPHRRTACHSAIVCRHRAINWLCGHHAIYSLVDTWT